MAAAKAPTASGVRPWWGIPYAGAERCRRPVVAEFNPDLSYDRKGVVSIHSNSGDWLEACSGMGEDCLNVNVCGGRVKQARHAKYGVVRVGQYLWSGDQILTEHADRFSAAIGSVAFFTAQWLLRRATVGVSCSCGSRKLQVLRSALCPWKRFCISGLFPDGVIIAATRGSHGADPVCTAPKEK
ncbi:hypothetical protein [Streptomyces rochei]|uniref:hypothetical protein n=1 Tax=Streptomyces rochei TaxID=1928 RepID=UPI00346590EB